MKIMLAMRQKICYIARRQLNRETIISVPPKRAANKGEAYEEQNPESFPGADDDQRCTPRMRRRQRIGHRRK